MTEEARRRVWTVLGIFTVVAFVLWMEWAMGGRLPLR